MSVQAVFFDFGGTLDSNGITWLDRFHPLYLAQGFNVSREEFVKAFYYSDDNLATRYDLRRVGLEDTITLQVHCVLEALSPKKKREVEQSAITKAFVSESRSSLNRARPILERLKLNHRLGIISNFYGNLSHILHTEGFHGLFDVIVDSGAVGHTKPSAEIFKFATDKLACAAEQCWMVGDSINRDMKGAETANMMHAWLRGSRSDTTSPCCGDVKILNNLSDLERILDEVTA